MVVLRDQTYPVEGGALTYDLFRPHGEGPFPLVVFLHGGGWISGDKTMYRDEALWLVPQGYACACIDYRLAPLYPFPTPVGDCQSFVTFASENAATLAIDPNNMTAMGNSAGGHLALMLGLCPTNLVTGDPTPTVHNVVSLCGISDLRDPGGAHYDIAMGFLEQFMDGPYEGSEERWAKASPAAYTGNAHGRFLLLHGTEDDVVPFDQGQKMADALTATGCETRFVPLPGEGHSFSFQSWETIRAEYTRFLAAALAPA